MRKSLRACINTRAFDGTAKYPSEAEVKKWEHVRQESSPFEQRDTLPLLSQGTLLYQQHHFNSTQTQADTNQESIPQVNPIALLDNIPSCFKNWEECVNVSILKMPPSSISWTLEVNPPSRMPSPSYWMSPVRTSKCSMQPVTWTSPYPSHIAVMTTQRSPSHPVQRQGGR